MLQRKPLARGAGQQIARRVHDAVLKIIADLRVVGGEGESEVDGLLGEDLILLHVIAEFDLLFRIKQEDIRLHLGRVHVRALEVCDQTKWHALNGDKPPTVAAMNGELRRGQLGIAEDQAVAARLVAAAYVKILIEVIGAGAVHQLFVQFLVENAFYRPALHIERHPVVFVFQDVPPSPLPRE